MSLRPLRPLRLVCASLLAAAVLHAQPAQPVEPPPFDDDTTALLLARQYLEGGSDSRAALLEALDRMGWGVRNAKGSLIKAPPAGTDTGLAMRDYELEELLWNPLEQPSIRLISVARALAVPFEHSDPEELAQDLVNAIRQSAESSQPQQRFWARFIIALGRASPDGYDLARPAPSPVIMPDFENTEVDTDNLFALAEAMLPKPIWPHDDPVLGASPKPKPRPGETVVSPQDRLQQRLEEINQEMVKLQGQLPSATPAQQAALHEQLRKLSTELGSLAQQHMAAVMQSANAAFETMKNPGAEDEDAPDLDPSAFAEWRDRPLSFLQITLITRVLVADLLRTAQPDTPSSTQAQHWIFSPHPFAAIGFPVAQAPTFGAQLQGALGDIWATGWGAYVEAVVDHHAPGNKYNKRVSAANAVVAWIKTLLSAIRQKITLTVENAPLIRTKTTTAGEQRTVRAKIEIEMPEGDALAAVRAAVNLTGVDLDLGEGGPVDGAKFVWRLPEGSRDDRSLSPTGDWQSGANKAVVQFAQGASYITTTNSAGETSITIEGIPQKKPLPSTVRRSPRRAAVAVEVTIKVGNVTQDLTDAIAIGTSEMIPGTFEFLADMMLRTSLLFNQKKHFEVIDWKPPAWEGEFEIKVSGSGSKHQKGEKGGPDTYYSWSMDRHVMGRLLTPEDEEEEEADADYQDEGTHQLEVDSDSRMFRLSDSSSVSSESGSARYRAQGPTQVPPPIPSELVFLSRAQPSGSALLKITEGNMTLDLMPFFTAECLVSRSEQSRGRSVNESGTEILNLLSGVEPGTFTFTEPYDGGDEIQGSKTYTYERGGNLPYVPTFGIKVTVSYRLWKNARPPQSQPN